MVALRSRRLETILATSLDDLQYHHLERLVTNHVPEAFDLDFKATLYGNRDADKRDLAGDVAALANTGGGLLVLGIAEDRQSRAVAAPGVTVSGAEVERILQVVGSLVVPLPVFDVLPIEKPGEPGHGFLVVAVLRSPLAPHAVIVGQGLRYPRRNGTTTRYLSEPEVATAYRERFAGAQRQAARAEEIEQDALPRLDTSDLTWVVVSLVPDLPGELAINGEVFRAFQSAVTDPSPTVVPGIIVRRVGVGRRRLLADGTMNSSPLARWCSLELHTDGSGVFSVCVLDLRGSLAQDDRGGIFRGLEQRINDESLVTAVMSGVLLLAQHARDRTAGGGNALIRAQIFPVSAERPTGLAHDRFHGIPTPIGDRVVTERPPAAEAAAALDELAQPGPVLAATSGLLVNEVGQAFGTAEVAPLSRDGQLRRRYWTQRQFVAWAEQNGIEVTDDTITA